MDSLQINFLLLFLFSSILCSCQTELKPANEKLTSQPKQAITFRAIDMDELRIESDSSENYYLHKRELLNNITTGDELYLHGSKPENSRIFSHSFMGSYTVIQKNDSTFQIQGKLFVPTTGNWDDGFGEHESFRFSLKIGSNGWTIFDLIIPTLNLKPELTNIDSLRQQLEKNPSCKAKDWDEAVKCFPLLKRYEFALFASATSGDTTYLDDYLRFQQHFDIAYAGEFAEYFRGNIYYLLLTQIITPQDLEERDMLDRYDLIRIVYRTWE